MSNFHTCSACGEQFMFKSTLLRHQAVERPVFMAWAAEKNHEYEVSRRRYRMANPLRAAVGSPA